MVDLDRIIAAHDLDLSDEALVAHVVALLDRAEWTCGRARRAEGGSRRRRRSSTGARVRDAVNERLGTSPGIMALDDREAARLALSAEARIPIDRVAARCDALLESTAPGTTDGRDLSADAVARLIGRAMRAHARGDLETAVLALELALSASRPEDGVDALLASHDALFRTVFTALIGDQSRMPDVAAPRAADRDRDRPARRVPSDAHRRHALDLRAARHVRPSQAGGLSPTVPTDAARARGPGVTTRLGDHRKGLRRRCRRVEQRLLVR